jgi:hypothetical protein
MDMKFMKGSLVATGLVLLLACFAGPAGATAVIEQNAGPSLYAMSNGIGQTFAWPIDSPLGVVRVRSDTAIAAAIKLYAGPHT